MFDVIAHGLRHRSGSLAKPELPAQLRQHHRRVLRHVDNRRCRAGAQVEEEADIPQPPGPLRALGVHVQFVALVHLVEHLLRHFQIARLNIRLFAANTGLDLLIHLVQLGLHLMAIADLGNMVGVVIDAIQVGAVTITTGALHSAAMDGVFGKAGIRQHLQHGLPHIILDG